MNENNSEIVIEAAKSYMAYMEEKHPGWEKAFFRCHVNVGSNHGGNGSYVKDGDVFLHGSLRCQDLYENLVGHLYELWESLKTEGKEFLVCLLVVDSSFNFNVYFEHNEANKWQISKLDGSNGTPSGYDGI